MDIEYKEDLYKIMSEVFPFLVELNFILSTDPFFFEKGKISFLGKFGFNGVSYRVSPCFQNKGKGFVKGELKKFLKDNKSTFLEAINDCLVGIDPEISIPTKVYDWFAENRG